MSYAKLASRCSLMDKLGSSFTFNLSRKSYTKGIHSVIVMGVWYGEYDPSSNLGLSFLHFT